MSGTTETILFAVKKGEPDYMEQVITNKAERIEDAKVWALNNGFHKMRVSTIDLSVRPDFAKPIQL